MSAGEYDTPFVWLKAARGGVSSFGARAVSRTPAGTLWGAVEDLAAVRVTEREADRQKVRGTVRIRNLVPVAAGDQLDDVGRGEVWDVTTARRGDNETVCEVER